MKEIVVISGKGGTGKTSITASFAFLGKDKIVCADCDVDAADMHLLLDPDFAQPQDFYSGVLAVIDQEKCIGCGKCSEICRYNAFDYTEETYKVNPLNCEGCGYCSHVCPVGAITMEDQNVGQYFFSQTRAENKMVHARLGIGAENSGKLVAQVKNEAKRIAEETGKEIVLVDGSPGIGCPVVSSLSGADYVVFVTEPTVSGLHDLKRVYELVKNFGIPAGCIINKADLNSNAKEQLKEFIKSENINPIAEIPYDESFTAAMTQGKAIVESEGRVKEILEESWDKIKQIIK